MKFKDKNIRDIIDRLKHHYELFVNNQFIKYYLNEFIIQKHDWLDIEDLIDFNKSISSPLQFITAMVEYFLCLSIP